MEINHILAIKCGLNALLQSYTNYFPVAAPIFHFDSPNSLLGSMAEIDVQEGSFQYVSSERVAHVQSRAVKLT